MRTEPWRGIEPLEARIAPAAVIELSGLDGNNGFKLSGAAAADVTGRSVSGAGDVNGDGVADFIVSAPGHSPGGLIYVIFGKAGAFGANLDLGALTPSQGFRIIDSVSLDYAGKSVSAAGDVNGDGFDDLIIGAPYADPNGVASGSAFVVFGKASFAADVDVATLDGTNGFRLNGIGDRDYTGGSVSGAGDINGDGFDDLVVAAPFAENGATFVVFGKGGGVRCNDRAQHAGRQQRISH